MKASPSPLNLDPGVNWGISTSRNLRTDSLKDNGKVWAEVFYPLGLGTRLSSHIKVTFKDRNKPAIEFPTQGRHWELYSESYLSLFLHYGNHETTAIAVERKGEERDSQGA